MLDGISRVPRWQRHVTSASAGHLWIEGWQGECDSLLRKGAAVMAESRRSSVESLTSRHVAFGQYLFNPGTGELWRGDKEIKLTPRAATLLAVLAERATLVVTKLELVARVWDGRAVGDDALTSCVQELRRALGDDPRQPQLIETRHRRGYRLLVPVSAAEPPAKNDTAPEPTAPLPLPDK